MILLDEIKSFFNINRRQLYKETEKMIENIKFKSDNCNVNSRIQYLTDNNIRVKYRVKDVNLNNNDLIKTSTPNSNKEYKRDER